MAKTKAKKKAKASKSKNGGGRLEKLCGFSVTSVIRRLGREGISFEDVKRIAKAKKVKMSDKSLSVQWSLGRMKKRTLADLDASQLSELKELANN
jgi:hypothetical protein